MIAAPVLFLIFNRPDHTKLVFEQIRLAKPKQLFIAADGPRENCDGEREKCEYAKHVVLENIDWECEVKTLFRQSNLGCGKAVSEAITWFFNHVDEGIILEDDCLPNSSFFSFCHELLEKYRHNSSIMHITCTNYNDSKKYEDGSYYFSNYPYIWGWATWKRAWQHYDYDLKDLPRYKKLIRQKFRDPFERKFWESRITMIQNKVVNTWDYQWMFSVWRENGISLTTNFNLVTNVGFGEDSTHTKGESPYLTPETKVLTQIVHPKSMIVSKDGDENFVETVLCVKRKGYSGFMVQRFVNLLHKIKLAFGMLKKANEA